MAIKLADCPPHLRDAIMRQLEKDGRTQPQEIVTYAVAQLVAGEWRVGPESSNKPLVAKLAHQLQNINARASYMTSQGKPPAVMIRLTRVAELKKVKANPKKETK